jgi:organic radical activating enzyme
MAEKESTITLPIAEVFTSVHGEGFWAGTPMTFVRLAGCTVGKMVGQGRTGDFELLPILPTGRKASQCTTFDGRTFPCDTDYSLTAQLSVEKIISLIPNHIKHICITGGEPLMHAERLKPLVSTLILDGLQVHFETSGTIDPPVGWKTTRHIWWACSPKANYLPFFIQRIADEIRVMVDQDIMIEDIAKLLNGVKSSTHIYFAPLSRQDNVMEFDPLSMQNAMKLVENFPGSRISIQMHKVLGVR